ncbi:MAG: hypothetical protein HOP19_26600 [Acidobacteria bacterium]|nr:hypothetical protein [Acidobacteriota bacterium]
MEKRQQRRTEYGTLYEIVSEILFRHDLMEINFGHNTDEYEPEVDTILPRLKECSSALDVRKVIHQEFVVWFDAEEAGSEQDYETIAQEVWAAWLKAKN